MDKLRAKVAWFIQMEKMTEFRKQVYEEALRKLVEWKPKTKSSRSKGKWRVDKPSKSKFIYYTPLTESSDVPSFSPIS